MTPKPIQWIGAVLVLGIVAVIGASAVQNLLRGEAKRTEIIMLAITVAVVVGALALRAVSNRRRPRRAARAARRRS